MKTNSTSFWRREIATHFHPFFISFLREGRRVPSGVEISLRDAAAAFLKIKTENREEI